MSNAVFSVLQHSQSSTAPTWQDMQLIELHSIARLGNFDNVLIQIHYAYFLSHEMLLRYPIDKTAVNFNLTKIEQAPKLGRAALMALVEWAAKHRSRSTSVEPHGVGETSQKESNKFDQSVGTNGTEEIKNVCSAGSDYQ